MLNRNKLQLHCSLEMQCKVGITAGAKLPWSTSSLTWICSNENTFTLPAERAVKLNSTLVQLCCPAVSSIMKGKEFIAVISIFSITFSSDQVPLRCLWPTQAKSLISFNIQLIRPSKKVYKTLFQITFPFSGFLQLVLTS